VKSRLLASNIYKTVGALVWLCLAAQPRLFSAQTNNPAPIFPSNRFLLVVETSHGMARRAEAMRQSVQGLLNSGLAAQAHRGDTLGLWTFNEELHTGGIPLQKWAPEDKQAISERIDGFLKAQKYENHARFDKIMPAVERLTRRSQFITVILVCMGETDMQGIPFDARINEFFRTWRVQKQDAGTPFVIALRGQDGRFVDCTMNPSPWPVELPALSKELLTPVKVPPPSLARTSKPAAVTSSVPPLIISGRKREASPPAVGPKPEQPPPPAATASTPTNTPVVGAPAPAPAASQQALATTSTPPSSAAALMATSAPTASGQPALTKSDIPSTALAESKAEPHDNAVEPAQGSQAEAHRWDSDHEKPVQAATAVPVNGSVYVALLGFTALVSIGAIVGAVWFWRLRAQRGHETSLITESLDRPKK
jgi:hypothetical protein